MRRTLQRLAAVGLAAVIAVPTVGAQSYPTASADLVLGQPDFDSVASGSGMDKFNEPQRLTYHAATDTLYVADIQNDRVLRWDNASQLSANNTPADASFGGSCGVTVPCFSSITAVAVDPDGNLYVADSAEQRILIWSNAAEATSGTDADYALLSTAPTASGTTAAYGLYVGGGKLYATTTSKLLSWSLADLPATNLAPTEQSYPSGWYRTGAIDPVTGGLWLAVANDSFIHYYADPADLSAATGRFGYIPPDSAGSSPTAVKFFWIESLAFDSEGTLFAADPFYQRVLGFTDAAAQATARFAEGSASTIGADLVFGQASMTEKNTGTGAAGMNFPYGVAYDARHAHLWVADTLNHRVLRIPYGEPQPDPTPTPIDGEPLPVPAACELTPDMAVSPERIELAAGGTATIEVALRNLCNDAPYRNADLLVSLSDGLSVVDGSAGLVNLGQRAAWQQLTLAAGETRRWTLTVQAGDTLPAAPQHITELYRLGRVASRIDGVFIATETAAAAPAAVTVEAPAAAPASPAPLPLVLPNTAGEAAAPTFVPTLIVLAITLAGALLIVRRVR